VEIKQVTKGENKRQQHKEREEEKWEQGGAKFM